MTRAKSTDGLTTCVLCGVGFRRLGRPGPSPRCPECRAALASPKRPISAVRHLIESVRFQGHVGPSDTAPIECTCGATTTVDGWFEHRREAGLITRSLPDLSPVIAADARAEAIHGGPQKQRRSPPGARFQ